MTGPCRERGCDQIRPCAEHDSAISLTPTEGGAVTRDPSAVDQTRLAEHMRLAQHHTAKAATIAVRWANPSLTTTDVAKRLQDIDRAIWCHNCAKHGLASQNRDGHPDFARHLRGKVEFVCSVDPERGAKLKDALAAALAKP